MDNASLHDAIEHEICNLADKLHRDLFPEEFVAASSDITDVVQGHQSNVSEDDGDEIARRRDALGVSALSDGKPIDDSAKKRCRIWAAENIYEARSLRLPPAERCLVCGETHEAVGSRRMISTSPLSITTRFLEPDETVGVESQVFPGGRLVINVKSTGDSDLNTKHLKRAKRVLKNGYYPWFCMACVGYVCKCGQPLASYPATDGIDADGSHWHTPVLAGRKTCPTCGIVP